MSLFQLVKKRSKSYKRQKSLSISTSTQLLNLQHPPKMRKRKGVFQYIFTVHVDHVYHKSHTCNSNSQYYCTDTKINETGKGHEL